VIRQINIAETAFTLFYDNIGSGGGIRNVGAGFIVGGIYNIMRSTTQNAKNQDRRITK
jgi:hypothetical protein